VVPGKPAPAGQSDVKTSFDTKLQNKVAVITGASSGIGAVTARKLASHGLKVVLIARRKDRLDALAEEIQHTNGQAEVIEGDLCSDADRQKIYENVTHTYGTADILINNAGFGWYGYSTDIPLAMAMQMIQVNISAVVHLTLLFLRKMIQQNQGHIINIGSISGSIPSQGIALYGATKSFLDAFTTSLYRETRNTKVRLSVVRSGPVQTEFFQTAENLPEGKPVPTRNHGIPSEVVANTIYRLLHRPRRYVYIPTYLGITPWVELSFGWLIDRLGPVLLKRTVESG